MRISRLDEVEEAEILRQICRTKDYCEDIDARNG